MSALALLWLVAAVAGGLAATLRRPVAAAALLGLSAAALAAWAISAGPDLTLSLGPVLGSVHLGMAGPSRLVAILAGLLLLAAAVAAARLDARGLGLYGLLTLAIGWFLAAQDPLALAIGWEAVTLATYALVLAGGSGRRVLRAGWKLLVLSEAGTVLYVCGFVAILAAHPGLAPDVPFPALAAAAPSGWALLAMAAGLGVKAALAPLHVWLPDAHAAAPAPVSSLLSGLTTAVAVAGMWKLLAVVPASALVGPGWVLLALGLAGAAAGALYGVIEPEIKRALAHGTVEVLGLVLASLGLSLLLPPGSAAASLAAVATLILLLQHAGAKFVLFLAAGEAVAATGSHRLDAMGGLLRHLPGGGAAAWVAVLSLAGVPPLGGFVGEWMLLESMLMPLPARAAEHQVLAALGALTALVMALGLTVYLRWFSATFLGAPRSRAAADAHFPREAAVTAGCVLALLPPVLAGVGTPWTVPLIQAALGARGGAPLVPPLFAQPQLQPGLVAVGAAVGRGLLPGARGVVVVPGNVFSILSPWDLFLVAAVLAACLVLVLPRRRRGLRTAPRWAGGEAMEPGLGLTAFTSSGLTHVFRLIFAGIYHARRGRELVAPDTYVYQVRVAHRFEHHLYRPAAAGLRRVARGAVRLANGSPLSYVGYVLAPVLVGLVVLSLRR